MVFGETLDFVGDFKEHANDGIQYEFLQYVFDAFHFFLYCLFRLG
jgi:hypothetical protein